MARGYHLGLHKYNHDMECFHHYNNYIGLCYSKASEQWFSTKDDFPSMAHLTVSGDFLVVIMWNLPQAPSEQKLRRLLKHHMMHRTAPQQRIILPKMSVEPPLRNPALETQSPWTSSIILWDAYSYYPYFINEETGLVSFKELDQDHTAIKEQS